MFISSYRIIGLYFVIAHKKTFCLISRLSGDIMLHSINQRPIIIRLDMTALTCYLSAYIVDWPDFRRLFVFFCLR